MLVRLRGCPCRCIDNYAYLLKKYCMVKAGLDESHAWRLERIRELSPLTDAQVLLSPHQAPAISVCVWFLRSCRRLIIQLVMCCVVLNPVILRVQVRSTATGVAALLRQTCCSCAQYRMQPVQSLQHSAARCCKPPPWTVRRPVPKHSEPAPCGNDHCSQKLPRSFGQ